MKTLAAKALAALALTAGLLLAPQARAGIPVIDVTNVTQTTITAIEEVAQTIKQIDQYTTQLREYATQIKQYQNMLQNTAAPAMYYWDLAQKTMYGVRGTIDTLAYYKKTSGGIDNYLARFQNVNYYRSSPCFQAVGCTAAQWDALKKQKELASESQKKANDALFRGLDMQQDALNADAKRLEQLQASVQTVDGQVKAIQNASMIAANTGNQLLQIRALLIAQQNAESSRRQALVDDEAIQQAAHEAAISNRGPTALPNKPKSWTP